jgi:CheY-like chemotaxis protein/two-component sensor histidine kinase
VSERDHRDAQADADPRESQKMEMLGRLAGGVAHDFNNLLAVILSYGELIVAETERGNVRAAALEICAAAHSAAAITRQLLDVSRREPRAPTLIDVNEVVHRMSAMLARVLGGSVTLSADVDDRIGAVVAHPGQMDQVLMNLMVNARDAMPRGGTVRVRTREETGGAGTTVVLSVSDDGGGIADEVLAHIFEPLFTTKADGVGTGLGLAIVDGIVKEIGGRIEVRTARGVGTTFAIHLPRVDAVVRPPRSERTPVSSARVCERILLVEDHEAVRRAIGTLLRRNGYSVVEACSREEAIAKCLGAREEIDLVVSDVVMPGMRCDAMLSMMRSIIPGLRVLLISGQPGPDDASRDPGGAFLEKPFSLDALLERVRDVLDSD